MATKQAQPSWSFGRMSPDEVPDQTPIPFTLYGYDRKTNEEHAYEFHAKATEPFGQTMDVMVLADDEGKVRGDVAIKYLYECLDEDDKDRWNEVVRDGALYFHPEVLAQMAEAFTAYYQGLNDELGPTLPRSSSGGSRRGGGTTTVEHSGRVSTSARSRRPMPST